MSESRFAAMANRPGGKKRADVVRNAETRVAAMEDDYIAEADRLLDRLDALTTVAGPDVGAIYREAAALRGLGGAFGYILVSEVAGSLCELADRLLAARQVDRPSMLAHVQSLALLHRRRVKGDGGSGEAALCDGLARLVARWPATTLP